MKARLGTLMTVAAVAAGLVAPLEADEERDDGGHAGVQRPRLTSDYDLEQGFDAKELRSLAGKPSLSHGEKRRAMLLVLHAAIERDASFQDLLDRRDLREATNLDLALSGYDYVLNKNEAALDHLLAQLATEDIGADVDTIVVLQILDEWDLTVRAFRKHFIYTDGAGGSCKRGFMATRAYLYPETYAEMREVIEAPVEWAAPLLPRQR